MTKGGKNLTILGVAAIVIALTTTTISLIIYHNSGDIYLDRSRPGYMPDETENEKESQKSGYTFSKTGEINAAVVDEYSENLNLEIEEIKEISDPFGADALSDESLGIPD